MPAYIQSIGTAVPPFVADQQTICSFMQRNLELSEEEEKKLRLLYRASGIQHRYSVLEDFSHPNEEKGLFKKGDFPSAKVRMDLFQENAVILAEKAATVALKDSRGSEITHLIAISCTGMYAPGLDIELIERLNLKTDTQRTSFNFMGCYAAFNGMKTAQNIVLSDPESKVLVVAVELCTLHLQDTTDDESLLSNSLFGDGATAFLVGSEKTSSCLELKGFYSDLFLQGKSEMGWYIGNHGFEMKLSPEVPDVIREGIGELTQRLLDKIEMRFSEIDLFAIHPGGRRILEVIEKELAISKEQNQASREVLKKYGNMSSATIMFVLQYLLHGFTKEDDEKQILSFAFGPGLTMESAIMQVHHA
ncbi:MAG: type III polyketide synthase [Bacteroidota bacterium]